MELVTSDDSKTFNLRHVQRSMGDHKAMTETPHDGVYVLDLEFQIRNPRFETPASEPR